MKEEVVIKVEGKEWKDLVDASFDTVIKDVKIDGFRKGKAPRNVYEKKYGKQELIYSAADKAIQDKYKEVVLEGKIVPILEPKIEVVKMDEESFEAKMVLITEPTVKLGNYKGLNVKKEEATVSDEEVQNHINSLLQEYAELAVKDGKVEDGDVAIIDFEGFKDGVAFDGGKATNYSLEIGSNSFIPGFEEQLIGMKKDDEKEIEVTFPEDYHSEELKGAKATFKIKVHEVKTTVIPEINEEFFEDLGMEGIDTLEKLENQVKENIKVRKEADAENKYLDELLDKASEGTEVNIPHVMIHEELDRMLEQYKQNLSMQGISLEQFYQFTNSNEEALKQEMHPEAEKRVKLRLMLEEIAKKENIEVTEEEAKEESKKLADKYKMDETEFLNAFGGLEMIKYDLKMRRAIDVLKK